MKYRYSIGQRVRVRKDRPTISTFAGRLGVVTEQHQTHGGVCRWYQLHFLRPIIVCGRDERKNGPYAFLEEMLEYA